MRYMGRRAAGGARGTFGPVPHASNNMRLAGGAWGTFGPVAHAVTT